MKIDRNITLKDGTNLTLLKEDNILTFIGGGIKQSRYEEEVKEISIAEFLIRVVGVFSSLLVLILVGIVIFLLPLPFIIDILAIFVILVISIIIRGLFGYFFVTKIFPNVSIGMAMEYEINNGKKKIVRYIPFKQKLNIDKKDRGLNEVLKCTNGLLAIIGGTLAIIGGTVWVTVYLHYLRLSHFFGFFLLLLYIIFVIRYKWRMPLNKPPEEVFPEWKYIGHMSANKLILICLIVSAVPALVIYYLWKMFF